MLPWEDRFDVKVYYEDTDSLGIVYYANYLKYFERARSEMFTYTGRSMLEWNQDGYNIAVAKANINFQAPGKLGDKCTVVTKRQQSVSPYRVKLKQELYRGDELLVDAMIHLVCLDHDLALREFPEDWLDDLMGEPPEDN